MTRVLIIYCILSLVLASPLHAQELEDLSTSTPDRKDITKDIEKQSEKVISEEIKQKDEKIEGQVSTEKLDTDSEIQNRDDSEKSNTETEDKLPEVKTDVPDFSPSPSPSASPPTPTVSSSSATSVPILAEVPASASAKDIPASPSADSANDVVNQTEIQQTVEQTASTGSNSVDTTEIAEVNTATAAAKTVTTTEVNTTIVGENTSYGVEHLTNPGYSLDLSKIQRDCHPTQSTSNEVVSINNSASIDNYVTVAAITGNNSAQGHSATTATGDALAEANIANIANTSLIGNCWFYQVINVFSPTNTTIVLPNDEQFLNSDVAQPESHPHIVDTNQTATISADIQTIADTGDNTADIITTGDSDAQTDITSITNTSLYGSSWFLIKITNPQYWNGKLLGNNYYSSSDGSALYFWLSPQSAMNLGDKTADTVTVNNTASVNNTVSLTALTGNNTAAGLHSEITTGNAYTELEILNLLNTTVVGSNWYFVMLNLFDNFEGDVSIARPDLAILAPSKTTVAPGDTITYKVAIANGGNSSAKDIVLTQRRSAWNSDDGGSTTTWNVGALAAQESTVVPITLSIPSNTLEGTYTISYQVSNSFTEHSKENNTVSFSITVEEPEIIKVVEYVYPQTQVYTYPQYYYQPQRNSYRYNTYQPAPKPQVQGFQDTETELTIPFPSHLNRAFCIKNWELCSAAGLLLTAGPVKAIERRKYFKINKQQF